MIKNTRRGLLRTAAAGLALSHVGHAAETSTEISFYFPVAVGGPITRIIDGYAADFQRENPAIKVTPIYAGTYQDTLTKAQTALKANAGPQMAVLLSTDVFSLIDDDLIVPFDTIAGSAADEAWLRSFYPAFLKNGEIDGHTWGVPFQRSTIVLYWNKAAFQETGLDPERPPANWTEHAEFAQRLTRRSGGGVDRWGVQIPASGFPYWLFQALATEAGAMLANEAGTETDFAAPGCIEALRYWIDLAGKYGASARHRRLGHHAARLSRTESGDDLDHDRQPVEHPRQREISLRRRNAAGGQAAGHTHRRREFLSFQDHEPTTAGGGPAVPPLDQQPRTRRAMGHRHRLRRDPAGCLGDGADAQLRRRIRGRFRGARPVAVRRGRVVDTRQPARDAGAE
jgi:hypothetical protein